jgi:hypothetical protein
VSYTEEILIDAPVRDVWRRHLPAGAPDAVVGSKETKSSCMFEGPDGQLGQRRLSFTRARVGYQEVVSLKQ